MGQFAQCFHVPAGTDQQVDRLVLQDLLDPAARALDELTHQFFEGNIRFIRLAQLVEQPHGSDLEAFGKDDVAVHRKGGLHAAAPDIHQQGDVFLQVDRFGYCQVDQAGFFFPADDLHRDPGGLQDAVDQDLLVGGLAHGAGGDRPVLAYAVIMDHLLKRGERIDRFLHIRFTDDPDPVLEGIFPQPDGNAQAFQRFQLAVLIHLADRQADRIRADINGSNCLRETHKVRSLGVSIPRERRSWIASFLYYAINLVQSINLH